MISHQSTFAVFLNLTFILNENMLDLSNSSRGLEFDSIATSWNQLTHFEVSLLHHDPIFISSSRLFAFCSHSIELLVLRYALSVFELLFRILKQIILYFLMFLIFLIVILQPLPAVIHIYEQSHCAFSESQIFRADVDFKKFQIFLKLFVTQLSKVQFCYRNHHLRKLSS